MAFTLPSLSLDLKVPISIYKAVGRIKLLATSQVCVPDPGILSDSTQLGPVHINALLFEKAYIWMRSGLPSTLIS